MKISLSMPRRLRDQVRLLFLWACFGFGAAPQAQEPPRLQAVLNAEKTLIRLELQGRAAINYDIEASTDLKVWTRVANGPAGNGLLLNEQPLSSQHRFFRGRESAGSTNGNTPPISITPLVSTNLSVSFLLSTNGGSALLYSPDGTQFRFTVPPLTLPESEIVTMTLVTNAVGLPFSQGMLGAVRLEPDRLALWGAGTLEITLRPGLDLRQIVSFTAHGNGSSFHLTPDRVVTNSVLIPVTRLGLFGSALALDTELSSTASLGAFIAHSDTVVRAQIAACPPEQDVGAEFLDERLTAASERYSQSVASALIQARRSQSAGVGGDTFNSELAVREVENGSCSLITEAVGPRANDAIYNCAISKLLLRHVSWLNGLRQFLRLPGGFACPSLQDWNVCGVLNNCLAEVKKCCESGIRGRPQFAAINEIVHLGQLVGPGCLSAAEIDKAMESCTPGRWTGVLYLIIAGEESHSEPVPGGSRSEIKKHTETFLGHVTESFELGSDQGTNVNLSVEGQVAVTIENTTIQIAAGDCGGYFGHRYEADVANGMVAFNVSFTISPGQAPSIIVFQNPEPMLHGRNTYHDFSRNGFYKLGDGGRECDAHVKSDSDNKPWTHVIGAALLAKPATYQDNQLTGSANLDRTQMQLDGIGTFGWRFKRHPERQ